MEEAVSSFLDMCMGDLKKQNKKNSGGIVKFLRHVFYYLISLKEFRTEVYIC